MCAKNDSQEIKARAGIRESVWDYRAGREWMVKTFPYLTGSPGLRSFNVESDKFTELYNAGASLDELVNQRAKVFTALRALMDACTRPKGGGMWFVIDADDPTPMVRAYIVLAGQGATFLVPDEKTWQRVMSVAGHFPWQNIIVQIATSEISTA